MSDSISNLGMNAKLTGPASASRQSIPSHQNGANQQSMMLASANTWLFPAIMSIVILVAGISVISLTIGYLMF